MWTILPVPLTPYSFLYNVLLGNFVSGCRVQITCFLRKRRDERQRAHRVVPCFLSPLCLTVGGKVLAKFKIFTIFKKIIKKKQYFPLVIHFFARSLVARILGVLCRFMIGRINIFDGYLTVGQMFNPKFVLGTRGVLSICQLSFRNIFQFCFIHRHFRFRFS